MKSLVGHLWGRLAWRTHSEEILFIVGDSSPWMKQIFESKGNWCKDLHIHNVLHSLCIDLGFRGMGIFDSLQCAVFVFVFPKMFTRMGIATAQTPGRPQRSPSLGSKWNRKGSISVPLVYLLSVKGKPALLPLWWVYSWIASSADFPGKREFLIRGTLR